MLTKRQGEPGPQHQQRGAQQQVPVMEAMAPGPHRQGGECRTQQGRCTQDADIQGAETERQQIGWKENCHIAIGKCPQGLAHQERQHYPVYTFRQQPAASHFNPRNRPIFFSGVSAHQA